MKIFLAVILSMSLGLNAFGQSMDSNNINDPSILKILEEFDAYLEYGISQERQEFQLNKISIDLDELSDELRSEAYKQLAVKIKLFSIDEYLSDNQISSNHPLAQIIVSSVVDKFLVFGLRVQLDEEDRNKSNLVNHVVIGAVVGAVAGLVIAAKAFGGLGKAFSNVNGSQNDLGTVLLTGFMIGLGGGAGAIIGVLENSYKNSESLEDFQILLKDEIEKLKQAKELVEDLD